MRVGSRRGRCARRPAATAGQRPDAGAALVADDVVGIVAVERRSVGDRPCRGRPSRAPRSSSTDWKPRTSRSGRRPPASGSRPASVRLRDRPVEQRDAVVPLEIGGVGQHQVGIGDHLRGIGVGDDDLRDDVFAGRRVRCRSASPWCRPCSSTSSRPCWPCRGRARRSGKGRRHGHWRSPCASCRGRRAALPRRRPCRCRFGRPSPSIARSSGPRG